MKRLGGLALRVFAVIAIAHLAVVNAQTQKTSQSVAQAGKSTTTHNAPQEAVVCTGWHALCSASTDCAMHGDKADCPCMRVNETHIVETGSIQDVEVKRMTLVRCTTQHPCNVDEAPVCKAIQTGQYEVDSIKYDWISTFSYRGWCTLMKTPPVACDPTADGYTGDLNWAICDAAPCTEIQNPSDPEKPLSCQCVVQNTPFLGTNGRCTGDNGGIMSSSPLWTWDFANNTYLIPIPGMTYVRSACAPLKSDPAPASGDMRVSR